MRNICASGGDMTKLSLACCIASACHRAETDLCKGGCHFDHIALTVSRRSNRQAFRKTSGINF